MADRDQFVSTQAELDDSRGTLNISDLAHLMIYLRNISYQWKHLGLYLGLTYTTLKKIEIEQRGGTSDCFREMLADWLQQSVSPSWSTLKTALKQMGENELADTIPTDDQVLETLKSSDDSVDPNVAMNSLGLKVSMSITNIGTQGYPGTGKTSLLDLAMGKDPAPTRTSTGCVDPPFYYLVVKKEYSDGVKWKHVTTDEMIEMVCGAIKKLLEDESNKTARKDSETDHVDQETLDILATQTARDDTDYYFLFSELLEKLRDSESSGKIFDSHWMMVTDCGGQPPFLDAAALFIRNSCLQIIPIKLDKPLDEKPEFSYFIGDESVSLSLPKVHLTNRQVTETLAKTVSAIQPPYTPSSKEARKRPKFTIVGTFKDVYEEQCRNGECKESIDQKESVLKEVLEKYKSVQVCGWNDEVILPVNAVTKDEEERKESASKLRELIDKSGTTMEVDIELWWFGLFLSILKTADKQKKAVLTIDECYELGKDLLRAELKKHADIESFFDKAKSETRKALQFLHDIGLIMYFDTPALKNVVFVYMKALLEKVSHLISVPFIRGDLFQKLYKISLPDGMQELLRQHGRFNRTHLDSFKLNKEITVDLFLSILEHVKAVVAINKTPNSAEYFMPCALPYATEEQCVPYSSPPWVIRFRIKRGIAKEYIPPPVGYLPTVVVFLLTRYPSHFYIDSASRQYRNQFELEYSGGGKVYIIERYPQLEVVYELPQFCLIIHDCVLNAMSLTEERLRLNKCSCEHKQECVCEGVIDKIDSFLCLCGKGGGRHLCTYMYMYNHHLRIAVCAKTNKPQHLEPTHLCWLQAGQKSVCGLTEAVRRDSLALDVDGISCNLMQHRFPHEQWAMLAVSLKLAVNISEFQDNDDFYQLKNVIDFWVCSDSQRSWEKLVKAIIFCKQKRVAKSLADAMNVSFSGYNSDPIASLHNAEAPLLDTNNAAYLLVGCGFPPEKWPQLADGLNFTEKKPECDQTHDSFICCLVSVLNKWIIKVNCEASWVKLAKAVEKCGEKEVADNLLKAITPNSATGVTPQQSSTVTNPINAQQLLTTEKSLQTDSHTDNSSVSADRSTPMEMAFVAGSSAESKALELKFEYLLNSINTDDLLPAALRSHIIVDRQRSECVSEPEPYKKAEKFLGHLLRAVNGDSNKYHTFIQILHETGQASIASHIQDALAHEKTRMMQSSNTEDKQLASPIDGSASKQPAFMSSNFQEEPKDTCSSSSSLAAGVASSHLKQTDGSKLSTHNQPPFLPLTDDNVTSAVCSMNKSVRGEGDVMEPTHTIPSTQKPEEEVKKDKQTDESKQDNKKLESTCRKAFKYLGYWWMWLLPVVIALLCVVYQFCKLYPMKPSVVPDSLPELVVYGETVLTVVGDKPQELRWPDYGFYLDIPEGSLPPDVTASVTVKVISGDQFELPENSQLISAVYWISSSVIFLKEVAVNIQHCAIITSEDQLSEFKFVIANRFHEVLPYDCKENGELVPSNHFKEREGLFSPHTQYGAIKLNQFSEIAVAAPSDTETLITGLMYYKKQQFPDSKSLKVDFHFIVVKNLEAYVQGVNMKHQEWSLDHHHLDIRFEDEAVVINQQEEEVDSWRIVPLSSPPQVAKDAVSKFHVGRSASVPHCAFELHLLHGKSLQQQPLLHKVDLTGVTFPHDFYIRYPLPKSNRVDSQQSWYEQLMPLFGLSAVVTVILSLVAYSVFRLWLKLTYCNKVKTYIQPTPLAGSLMVQEPVVSQQNQELENIAIHTVEELLKELPKITDPVDFGIHLDVRYSVCQQKVKENVGDVNAQVRSIASAWYEGSSHPTWNEVVKALSEHKLVHDAVLLAKRKGVKLPQSQHGDSDHNEL